MEQDDGWQVRVKDYRFLSKIQLCANIDWMDRSTFIGITFCYLHLNSAPHYAIILSILKLCRQVAAMCEREYCKIDSHLNVGLLQIGVNLFDNWSRGVN